MLFLFIGKESLESDETLVGGTLVTGKSQAEFVTPTFATVDDFIKTAKNVSDRQVTNSFTIEAEKVDIDLSMSDASDDESTDSTRVSKRQRLFRGTSPSSKVRGGTSPKQGDKRTPKATTPSKGPNSKRKDASIELGENITETPPLAQTQIFPSGTNVAACYTNADAYAKIDLVDQEGPRRQWAEDNNNNQKKLAKDQGWEKELSWYKGKVDHVWRNSKGE